MIAQIPAARYPLAAMQEFLHINREDWLKRLPSTISLEKADQILFGRLPGSRSHRPLFGPWKLLMRMDHPDAGKAAVQAHEDLAGGADGFVVTDADVVPKLRDFPLHALKLHNEAGDAGAEALHKLIGVLPLDPSRLAVDFGAMSAKVARPLQAAGFAGPFMRADGRVGHAHGLSDGQELGAVLAQVLGCFRALDFLPDAQLAGAVSVVLSATQNAFKTLAKFRAMRLLWASLLQHCGLPITALKLHGETSRMMYATTDVHANILRSVAAAFGAGLGGADSFCVLPFSQMQGLSNGFARRVARNLQHVMLREAGLWHVEDPASGAGFVEHETQRLCGEAWTVMQNCERGDWPTGDRDQSAARPIIGVERYISSQVQPPEIEVAS